MAVKKKITTVLAVYLLLFSVFAVLTQNYTAKALTSEAELTGITADGGKDTDGDGKYDYLEVSVEINVSVAGNYHIEASQLVDENDFTFNLFTHSEGYLNIGIHHLSLSFYGPSIYNAHFCPQNISMIYLYLWEEYYHKFLDDIMNVPLSQIYNYTDFDCRAVLTGAIYDEGIDNNGNGLFEALQIGVNIDVTDDAAYSVNLEGLEGTTFVPIFNSSKIFLTTGIRTVNVSLYGPTIFGYIYRLQGNVSYVQFSLGIEENGEHYWLGGMGHIPLNKTYMYYEFEPHAFFTDRIFDRGVDLDNNELFDYLEVGVEVNVTKAGSYRITTDGLAEKTDGVPTLYYHHYFDVTLEANIHRINFTFPGPFIANYHFNPTNITGLRLAEQSYDLDYIPMAPLSTKYNYTLFDAPLKDMQVNFVVYPNGTMSIGGTANFTHMYPQNMGPLVNTTLRFSTIGDTTRGSANGTFVLPEGDTFGWPLNSTTAILASQYNNGLLNATLEATILMPPEGSITYPTNASDFSFNSAYSNGLLDVRLLSETEIPSSMLPFNITDLVVLADYAENEISGNITFRAASGFPLGDILVYIDGNKTDLYLTGHVNVTYGNLFGIDINSTILDEMLANFTRDIPGPNGLVYNMTWGFLECTQFNTTKIPWAGDMGADIQYNVTVHGNFTGFLARLLTKMFFGGSSEQESFLYAALDSAFSSVQTASLSLNYYSASGIASINLQLASDVKALWNKAILLIPLTVPPENMTLVEAWLKTANATAYAIEDFSLNASFSSSEQQLGLHAWLSANITKLKDDVLPILPDAVPPELQAIVESYTNTTYCELTSSDATFNYVNGMADFDINWVLQGDFKAQINHAKRFYIDYLNATSPWMFTWQHLMLNATELNIDNFEAEFKMSKDWMCLTFNGLIVQPPKDEIDFIRFKLHRFFNMTSEDPQEPPREFEKLQIAITSGFNGTHTILLYAPGTLPAPDTTSLDYKTMIWQNVTISKLKDLLFQIAYQGVIDYLGKTYYVPVFTNSTVSDFSFSPNAKRISFNVTGTAGTGFCNITIPRSVLYAALEDWTIKIDGIPLSSENFGVTENAEYVFIYLSYLHSSHLIEIEGTWIVTEYPLNMLLPIMMTLILIVAVIAIKHRRKLGTIKTRYQSVIHTFADKLHQLKA